MSGYLAVSQIVLEHSLQALQIIEGDGTLYTGCGSSFLCKQRGEEGYELVTGAQCPQRDRMCLLLLGAQGGGGRELGIKELHCWVLKKKKSSFYANSLLYKRKLSYV